MKKNTANKLFAIGCLLLMFSCTAKKQLIVKKTFVADTIAKTVDYKSAKLNAIRAAQTVFNTFSGKARANINIGDESNDVTLNIRVQRGQKIWVSITAIASIEVARALITPDSIFLVNKLQSTYLKNPFSYINQYAGGQVNFKTLESLLVGNAIPELLNDSTDVQPDNNGGAILTGNLANLTYKVMVSPDLNTKQINLDDKNSAQMLQVTNSAFIKAGNRAMPSQIDMSAVVKYKKILVNLRYIREDFDRPLDFPFSIPSRYTSSQ